MKTILVTGGGGFLGSNLVASLAERGTHRLVVCDSFGDDGKWRNLLSSPVDEVITPAALMPWLTSHAGQIDAVLHFGSPAPTADTEIGHLLDSNATASTALWDWCAAERVRFFYASSFAVYGQGEAGYQDGEDLAQMARLRPVHPIGWTKLIFDRYAARQATLDKAPPQWVGLRLFSAYGPNEYHKGEQRSVIHKAYPNALHNQPMKLYRPGRANMPPERMARDFVYALDVVDAILWLFDHPDISGIYNIGSGQARSFEDMANAVYSALDRTPLIKYIDMPPEIERHYQYSAPADLTRLRAVGYNRPFLSLEEGVRHYAQHYLSQPNPYR